MVTPRWAESYPLPVGEVGFMVLPTVGVGGLFGYFPLGERVLFFPPGKWGSQLLPSGGEGALCSCHWGTRLQGSFSLGKRVGYLVTPRWREGSVLPAGVVGFMVTPHWG